MKYSLAAITLFATLAFSFLDHDVLTKINNELSQEISPRERLFLHVDNNLVEQGKHIWFKAYLTQSNNLEKSDLSKVLYVDFLTHQGIKLLEKKYQIDNGIVGGSVFIPDSLESDNYILSAYTQELKRFNKGFTQMIEVKRYASLFKSCQITFDKDNYESGDDISFSLKTLDINNDPIGKVKYSYKLYNQGVVIEEGEDKTDKVGLNSHQLSFDKNQFLIDPLVVVTTTFEDKKNDFYFEVPREFYRIDQVEFFPEGGRIVENLTCRVGFKAVNKIGTPVSFHGHIVDQNGKEIVPIKSNKYGYGSFKFKPLANNKYSFKLANSDQLFELPQVSSRGYQLMLDSEYDGEGDVLYKVTKSDGLDPVIHSALIFNKKVVHFSTLNLDDQNEFKISVDTLGQGIAELRLYNQKGEMEASRLVYINREDQLKFNFEFSENVEKAGEFVELEIQIKDDSNKAVSGEYSVSVTEDVSLFHKGFITPNIVSSLLFEGQVSSPIPNGSKFGMTNYFNNLDLNELLLILSFESHEYLKKQPKFKTNFISNSEDYIHGLVLDKNNVPQAGVDIVAIIKGSWDRSILTSDEFGFFRLPIALLDENSNGFIVGLADEKLYKDLRLKIEENTYAPVSISRLTVRDVSPDPMRVNEAPDFMDARILPEITVEEDNYQNEFLSKKVTHYGSFTSMAKDGSQLKIGQDFLAYIRQVTNVAYVNKPADGNIVFRGIPKSTGQTFGGGGYPALFILDGVPLGYNYHDLDYLTVDQIKSIDIIKSSSAVVTYGTRATGGVIVVKTGLANGGNSGQSFTQKKLEENLLNEFDRAVSFDFFEPLRKFEDFNSLNDNSLKTTLFWSDNLQVDENGVAKIRYRNADLPAQIKITINGISENQVLGYATNSYFVNP